MWNCNISEFGQIRFFKNRQYKPNWEFGSRYPLLLLLLIFKVHLEFTIISLWQQSSYFYLKRTVNERTGYKVKILSFLSLYYSPLYHWGLICGLAHRRSTVVICWINDGKKEWMEQEERFRLKKNVGLIYNNHIKFCCANSRIRACQILQGLNSGT